MSKAENVLKFYRELPFNFSETAAIAADKIRQSNSAVFYPTMHQQLQAGKINNAIDVGCGPGWLALSLAHHYNIDVHGVDFNPIAIDRAKEVAALLNVNVNFEISDLFSLQAQKKYDLVTSIGVLHHTEDCMGAIRFLADSLMRPGSFLFIGLYHLYGRRPFIDHFRKLKSQGCSAGELKKEYGILDKRFENDPTHLDSWFRDQVLHPHETQHTLKEVNLVLQETGLDFISSSIDGNVSDDVNAVIKQEKLVEKTAKKHLKARNYFPGFFTVFARKR